MRLDSSRKPSWPEDSASRRRWSAGSCAASGGAVRDGLGRPGRRFLTRGARRWRAPLRAEDYEWLAGEQVVTAVAATRVPPRSTERPVVAVHTVPNVEEVLPVVSADDVDARPGDDPVVPRSALGDVITTAGQDHVPAAAACDVIASAEGADPVSTRETRERIHTRRPADRAPRPRDLGHRATKHRQPTAVLRPDRLRVEPVPGEKHDLARAVGKRSHPGTGSVDVHD